MNIHSLEQAIVRQGTLARAGVPQDVREIARLADEGKLTNAEANRKLDGINRRNRAKVEQRFARTAVSRTRADAERARRAAIAAARRRGRAALGSYR